MCRKMAIDMDMVRRMHVHMNTDNSTKTEIDTEIAMDIQRFGCRIDISQQSLIRYPTKSRTLPSSVRYRRSNIMLIWKACNLTSFSPCLTGPVDYPFASHHKGPGFKSPGGYLCGTRILLLAMSRFIGDPDVIDHCGLL
jgi:hypothetical protein